MIKYLYSLFQLLGVVRRVYVNIRKQNAFLLEDFLPVWEDKLKESDGSLTLRDLQRLKIYGLTIPSVLGEAFCELRGVEMTQKERVSLTSFASITGMFDDLFDSHEKNPDYVESFMNNYKQVNLNSFETLLVEMFELGFCNSQHPDAIKQYMRCVFESQVESNRQKSHLTTLEDLREITFRKGGVSMPFYRCGLTGEIHRTEYELLYELGAIGQMANDIFDVYVDSQEGIRTMMTETKQIWQMKREYLMKVEQVFKKLDAVHYPEKQRKRFKLYVSLILARALVCLDQYESLTKKNNSFFNVKAYSRNQLVCDMEKPINQLKLLHYAALCNKK